MRIFYVAQRTVTVHNLSHPAANGLEYVIGQLEVAQPALAPHGVPLSVTRTTSLDRAGPDSMKGLRPLPFSPYGVGALDMGFPVSQKFHRARRSYAYIPRRVMSRSVLEGSLPPKPHTYSMICVEPYILPFYSFRPL